MKSGIVEFYVEKLEYIKDCNNPKLDFISPLSKRRLSKFDKVALYTMNKCMDEEVDYIVFSSESGEVERLLKIIEQYSTQGEVSPAVFSGSVHNYPVGFFLFNSKRSIPYNAMGGFENSISSGFLSAVISNYNNVLFCYADINEDDFCSFALKISKNKKNNLQKYILNQQNTYDKHDNFDEFVNFFSGKQPFLESYIFKIERNNDD